jgi:hypothetical protein
MQDSALLPLNLLYLRWLLDGLPAIIFNWQLSYATQLNANDEAITNSDYFSNSGVDIVLGAVNIVYNAIIKIYLYK